MTSKEEVERVKGRNNVLDQMKALHDSKETSKEEKAFLRVVVHYVRSHAFSGTWSPPLEVVMTVIECPQGATYLYETLRSPIHGSGWGRPDFYILKRMFEAKANKKFSELDYYFL